MYFEEKPRRRPSYPRHSPRIVLRASYDSLHDQGPGGVITIRPSDPLRHRVPVDLKEVLGIYEAGKSNGAAPVQTKPEEAPRKEVFVIDKNDVYRRRRRSSASTSSSRSIKEMKRRLSKMWQRDDIEKQVRPQLETEREKKRRFREEMREVERENFVDGAMDARKHWYPSEPQYQRESYQRENLDFGRRKYY